MSQSIFNKNKYELTAHMMELNILGSNSVKNREAWHAAIHGVAKSWTQLSS